MRAEHFSIVGAQMQRASCLVFMSDHGSCAEIVDNPAFWNLEERTYQFTTNQFCAPLRDHVNAFLHELLSEPPAKLTKGRAQST